MTIRWRFRGVHEDGGLTGGDQAAMNFRDDVGAFVRETLQNSLDARRGGGGRPVRVRFALRRLAGEEKRRFLHAADWPALRPHLEATGKLLPRARRAAAALERADSTIDLLVLSDGDAVGLAGAETGTSRFANFARHKLFSEKQSEQAGGSYGLGKSVLWSASSLSTIFFHSIPVDAEDRPEDARLFGVAQLPYHRTSEGEWDGPGWFGSPRPGHAGVSDSVRKPAAEMLAALRLERAAEFGTGTTFVVPAFAPMAEANDDDVAQEIENHAVKWFWPAMIGAAPPLVVELEVGGAVRQLDAARSPYAVFAHLSGGAPLAAWKDAARRRPLELLLPATQADVDDPAFRRHIRRSVGDALELAMLASDEGLPDAAKGRIALVRGAGMVVQYLELRNDRPCAGLLRAGAALGDGDDALDVDQYLRFAEPPSHDEWTGDAPKLRDRYQRGYKTPLNELPRRIRETALALLRDSERAGAGAEIPAALRKALSVGAGKALGPTERGGRFDFVVTETALVEDGGRLGWRFAARATCTRAKPWRLNVIARIAADFGGEELPLARCDVRGSAGGGAPAIAPGLFELADEAVEIAGFAPLGASAPFADRLRFELELRAKSTPRSVENESAVAAAASTAPADGAGS
jgi:hypothetical protein